MPVPDQHLRRLDRCLAEHERALARAAHDPEGDATVHRTLLAIGRNPYVLWALDELWDHPSLAVRYDAPTYFNRFGVPVPLDADVRFTTGDRDVRLEATFDHGHHRYVVTWDRREGFSLQRDMTPRRTA